MNEDYVESVDWCWEGKPKHLGGKPVPVTLFLPKFTHGLALDQAQEIHAERPVTNCLSNVTVRFSVVYR